MSVDVLPSPAEIQVYADRDELEYQQLLATLSASFPATSDKGFDFDRIKGNLKSRTGKAAVLYMSCTGWSTAEIADVLGVTTAAVNRYLLDVLAEAVPIEDIENLRRLISHRLDVVAKMAHEQYARSCEDAEETHEALTKDGDIVELKKHKPQSGNASYLKILSDIEKQRARLFGADQPQRLEVDKTERVMRINVVEVRTREEAVAFQEQQRIASEARSQE